MFRTTLKSSLFVAVVASAVALPLVGGCQSDAGRDRTGKAITSLHDTRDELTNASKQVNEVMASAKALESNPADLQAAYAAYKKEVAETDAAATSARTRSEDMQARAKEYQAKWHEEMSKVTNPDLKAAAEARAAKVKDRYATIQGKAQDVRESYQPFITDLKELQTYLSNDLTAPAVQAAKPVFGKIESSGKTLNEKLMALQKELDDVAMELSPPPPPATKPAKM